jgi:glycosyltransferase involved in cell wall biosynthesis
MRILMFSWEYPPHLVGGMGAHVAALVPALAAQGVEVAVVTPRWKGGPEVEPLRANAMVYRVQTPVADPSNFFADTQQTNLTLEHFAQNLWGQGGGFDIIHAHDWLVSFAAEALKKLHKTPLIATMHATERGRGRGQLYGEMANAINGAEWWLTYEAWRVIATSRFMAREVRDYFQLPSDKIFVIPNGVDVHRFDAIPENELTAIRNQWAEPHVRIVFFIGRVQHEKGVEVLLDAAAKILVYDQGVKFIIAGTGTLLSSLRDRVDSLGIGDQVLLPGYVSDAMRDQLYRIADVAVFPSLYEPFGIVALEAMAAHCPVIVSDVGGLGEVVDDGVTGIKVEAGRSDLLAQAIMRSLHDRRAAMEMADHAFSVVCHEYTWDQIARATIELYQDVSNLRSNTPWD